ncbi:MAG: HigA family addiction module antitoxin [Muribaculaceae bacterium]|nr:HigA family addiction module antitoxin [Muribaculaceae bacterium]
MITLPGIDPSMIANNLTPFEATHPGTLIRDELEVRKITQAKLAEQIGVSPSLLNEIVNGKRAVNTEMALMLEAALGIAAHIWLDLQSDYNMQKAKSDTSFISKLANIRRVAAIQ